MDLARHLFVPIFFFSFWANAQQGDSDRQRIINLFEGTYLEVMCRNGDPQLINKSFHPAFRMYVYYNNEVSFRSRDEWISRLEANRGKGALDSWKFVDIDISDTTAMVKLNVYANGELKFVDYFMLYKLEEGWRVFAKCFSMH